MSRPFRTPSSRRWPGRFIDGLVPVAMCPYFSRPWTGTFYPPRLCLPRCRLQKSLQTGQCRRIAQPLLRIGLDQSVVVSFCPPLWSIINSKPVHQLRPVCIAPNLLIASRPIPPCISVSGAEIAIVVGGHVTVPRRTDNALLQFGRKETARPREPQLPRPARAENDLHAWVIFQRVHQQRCPHEQSAFCAQHWTALDQIRLVRVQDSIKIQKKNHLDLSRNVLRIAPTWRSHLHVSSHACWRRYTQGRCDSSP